MLSHHERQELQRIETWFERYEPELAHDLSNGSAPRRRRGPSRSLVIGLYVVAAALLVPSAIVEAFPVVFLGVLAFVGAVTAQVSRRRTHRQGRGVQR